MVLAQQNLVPQPSLLPWLLGENLKKTEIQRSNAPALDLLYERTPAQPFEVISHLCFGFLNTSKLGNLFKLLTMLALTKSPSDVLLNYSLLFTGDEIKFFLKTSNQENNRRQK